MGVDQILNDRRGKPQVLVHVSTYQGNPFWNSGCLSHSHMWQHRFSFWKGWRIIPSQRKHNTNRNLACHFPPPPPKKKKEERKWSTTSRYIGHQI